MNRPSGVAQASAPAGSGGVPPPVSGSRTETVRKLAAGTAALHSGSWKAYDIAVFTDEEKCKYIVSVLCDFNTEAGN